MTLVTVARYRAITGDSLTADDAVGGFVLDAMALLEDALGRPLLSAERTETLWPTHDGRLWPTAVPITDPGDYQQDGAALLSTAPFWPYESSDPWPISSNRSVSVTYTGGWVERTANPSAANRLPVSIERDLAWVAWALGHPEQAAAAAAVPAGATGLSLGDASVSFADGSVATVPAEVGVRWSAQTLSWRHSQVGGL